MVLFCSNYFCYYLLFLVSQLYILLFCFSFCFVYCLQFLLFLYTSVTYFFRTALDSFSGNSVSRGNGCIPSPNSTLWNYIECVVVVELHRVCCKNTKFFDCLKGIQQYYAYKK